MITIDIVDDNNERSAKPVVQAYPVASNEQLGSFDAAYESARSFYTDLLRVAQQERHARQAKTPRSSDGASMHEAYLALNRIARALTAWL